jgi:enterochelin esterase-like enzyme
VGVLLAAANPQRVGHLVLASPSSWKVYEKKTKTKTKTKKKKTKKKEKKNLFLSYP